MRKGSDEILMPTLDVTEHEMVESENEKGTVEERKDEDSVENGEVMIDGRSDEDNERPTFVERNDEYSNGNID